MFTNANNYFSVTVLDLKSGAQKRRIEGPNIFWLCGVLHLLSEYLCILFTTLCIVFYTYNTCLSFLMFPCSLNHVHYRKINNNSGHNYELIVFNNILAIENSLIINCISGNPPLVGTCIIFSLIYLSYMIFSLVSSF